MDRGEKIIFCARRICLPALLISGLALGACGRAERFDYRSDREVKPGPGLFSGKKGAFIIYEK
ncbi:MAG: hypothetical protein V3V56_03530 [bacterium]